MIDGTWKTHNVWYGLKEGLVQMAPYGPAVPPDVQAKAEEVRTGIIDGTYQPFGGPIKDATGEVRIAEGETAPDAMLLGMDWYVEGGAGLELYLLPVPIRTDCRERHGTATLDPRSSRG